MDTIETNIIDSELLKNKSSDNAILRDCVRSVLTNYINDLEGHSVDDLYQLVLAEVEAPLLETILGHTNGNQSKAAQMLGINRGTLRKKLKQYNIND
ncbi:MAG: DNA-binding transcriptional regulator Fis [Gammaproteobacteria bacterium]|nr:DNA-binding transcriptional regulator Fis [Gammaproteobacteria bacterium]